MVLRRSLLTVGCFFALNLMLLQLGPLGCGDCDLDITTNSLPDAVVGVSYNVGLDSDCGGDAWFLQSGLLPPGIGLIQDGGLRGVPSMAGTFNFVLEVVDFSGGYVNETAFKGLALTVRESPAPTPIPTATSGT